MCRFCASTSQRTPDDSRASKASQDLYSLGGQDFLITVDTYSGFWEVDELPQTTAADVINKTKQHLARYGIPDRVYSDNGSHFDCTEYAPFADDWQFEHFTSSPYRKQSNGLLEAAVKSAKTLNKKAQKTGRDIWMSFLDYRNTLTEGMDSSPVNKANSITEISVNNRNVTNSKRIAEAFNEYFGNMHRPKLGI